MHKSPSKLHSSSRKSKHGSRNLKTSLANNTGDQKPSQNKRNKKPTLQHELPYIHTKNCIYMRTQTAAHLRKREEWLRARAERNAGGGARNFGLAYRVVRRRIMIV